MKGCVLSDPRQGRGPACGRAPAYLHGRQPTVRVAESQSAAAKEAGGLRAVNDRVREPSGMRTRGPRSRRNRSSMVARQPTLAIALLLASSMTLADDTLARNFCDASPHDEVCPVLPKDNTDFDASFIYLNLEKNAQNPFDIFSWQTFVALNWPANEAGVALEERIGNHPDRPRVWQSYKRPGDVFGFARGEEDSCRPGMTAENRDGSDLPVQRQSAHRSGSELHRLRHPPERPCRGVHRRQRSRLGGRSATLPGGRPGGRLPSRPLPGQGDTDRRRARRDRDQDIVEDPRRRRARRGAVLLHRRCADRGSGGSERDR